MTIAIALLSAITGRAIYRDVAMTGEITLRGRILPVGGIREKILAAHRAGIKKVIIPEKNLKDLVDVPKKVLDKVTILTANNLAQVIDFALSPEEQVKKKPSFTQKRKRKASETDDKA